MNLKMTYIEAMSIANDQGWSIICIQKNIGMISFKKNIDGGQARINIYLSKMTVTSIIDHPKKGRNSLYRKKVKQKLLEKIFKNPRIHTGKGFRRK